MKNLVPKFILLKDRQGKFQGQFTATTIFIDIKGFTPLTEKLLKEKRHGAETLSVILEKVFKPITAIIYINSGFISGFVGDGLTAVFPSEKANTLMALTCAHQISNHIIENRIQYTEFGNFDISLKIGISHGLVNWGTIGYKNIKTYYFRGKAIDRCSKSKRISDKTEIIIDRSVIQQVNHEDIIVERLDQNYFILKEINSGDNENKNFSNLTYDISIDTDLYRNFVSDDVFDLPYRGEFRDITSVLVSFKNYNSHQLLNDFIRSILKEVINYGGYFSSLNFGDKGATFLIIFGAPLSHENNVQRALDFGLNIINQNVKMGINRGLAYSGFIGDDIRCQYTALGEVVNLSSRFMEKAQFGEIWVSQNIEQEYSDRYKIQLIDNILFKGKSSPLPVYKLIAKNSPQYHIWDVKKICDRNDEKKILKDCLNDLEKGKFQGVVNIQGEMGIGKTSLINYVLEDYQQKFQIFYWKCDSILRKSLNPIIYFLENFFNQWGLSDEISKKQKFEERYNQSIDLIKDKQDLNRDYFQNFIRIKPLIGFILFADYLNGTVYDKLEPKQKYENSLFALKEFLVVLSSVKPVVLFIDDYHWIDDETKKFLEIFLRSLENHPVLIITAGRFTENIELSEINHSASWKVKQINLNRFDYQHSSEIIRQMYNQDVPESLVSYVFKKSQGNPFYIKQLCQYFQDNEIFDNQVNEVNKIDVEIPDSITSIIISRIDKLPKKQKEVIQLCSVLGMDFDLNILYSLVKVNNQIEFENFTDMVNSITENGILIKADKSHYSFASSLYRDVVYDMQLKARLSKLHGLVGDSLEKLYIKEVSYHYDIASHFYLAGNRQKSIFYYSSAGNHYKQQYKNLEALDCCEKILKLKPGKKIKNKTLYLRAYINFVQGSWESSIRDLIYLIEQPDELELKIILDSKNLLSQIYLYQEKVEDALKIAISGLNQAKINKFDVKMDNFKTNIGQIYFRQNKYDEAMNIYREIINRHENDGNSEFVSIALGNIGLIYWNRGEFDQAVNCYRRQININIKNDDKFGLSVAYLNLGSVLFHRNQVEKAMEYFAKTKQICEQIGYKRVLSSAVGNMGAVYVDRGDISSAFECFITKKKISLDLGDQRGLSVAVGNLGTIYMEIGNYEFALDCLNQKKKISEELNDQRSSVYAAMYIGDLYRRKEDYHLAIENYKKAFSIAENINLKIGLDEISSKMGLTYALNGEYLKSLQTNKNSLLMEKELKTKGYTYYYSIGICFANIDPTIKQAKEISKITGKGTEPENYLQHSLKEMKREKDNIEYANLLKQYAEYLNSKRDKVQSKKYLNQSRKIVKRIKSTKLNAS